MNPVTRFLPRKQLSWDESYHLGIQKSMGRRLRLPGIAVYEATYARHGHWVGACIGADTDAGQQRVTLFLRVAV